METVLRLRYTALRQLVVPATLLLPALLLTGCAGTGAASEELAIRTEPGGATCDITRGAATIGTVDPTPGTLTVSHSDKPLSITCRKPGYEPAVTTVIPSYQGIGLGRLLTGGAAAVVEDAAKSDDFRYDPAGASLTLRPR